jgi:hypothetical protein
MEHPETHLVTPENGPAPAGRPDECYHCHEKVGKPHAPTCAHRRRTVVVRAVVEYVVTVTEHWDPSDVEFHRNESSWCCDNLLSELGAIAEARGCLCTPGIVRTEFVREATAEDETNSFGAPGLEPQRKPEAEN